MKPELARAAIEFLKRTDLKGVEAFVLVDVLRELDSEANAKPAAPFNAANYVNFHPRSAEPDAEAARAILEGIARDAAE